MRYFPAAFTFAAIAFISSSMLADSVELSNGDVLHGKVVSLDGSLLKLRSEVHGEMSIARDKVARISLGDGPAKPASEKPAAKGKAEAEVNPQDRARQLLKDGVNPKDLAALQQQFPALATSPQAQKYFNDTVAGLVSGKLDVQDLRKDAIKARNELKALQADLKKQLGDDGGMLDGYLSILEKFIAETEPAKPPANAPAPAPAPAPAQPAPASPTAPAKPAP